MWLNALEDFGEAAEKKRFRNLEIDTGLEQQNGTFKQRLANVVEYADTASGLGFHKKNLKL